MRKLFVIFAAVALAFAFTTPAKADVSLSGYVAMQTYMTDIDNPGATLDTSDLNWTTDTVCSRLTLSFKEGPVTGLVEIRPFITSYVRHWWGTWNFGAGTLGVGQFWTPEFSSISSMAYGCGAMDILDAGGSVRQQMIQLQFGGLKIAGGPPSTAGVAALFAGYTDTETSMPKLMASYDLNIAMLGLKFFGGYNSVDARNATTDATIGVDSYMVGVNVTAGFGPLTIKGQFWTAENPTEYGTGSTAANGYLPATATGTTINDVSFTAYGVDLAYKVSDAWKVTAGYFTGKSDRTDVAVETEDATATYHVNATWTLAKGVTITPEYAVLDRDDIKVGGVSTEQATDTRYGVYWKIAF